MANVCGVRYHNSLEGDSDAYNISHKPIVALTEPDFSTSGSACGMNLAKRWLRMCDMSRKLSSGSCIMQRCSFSNDSKNRDSDWWYEDLCGEWKSLPLPSPFPPLSSPILPLSFPASASSPTPSLIRPVLANPLSSPTSQQSTSSTPLKTDMSHDTRSNYKWKTR